MIVKCGVREVSRCYWSELCVIVLFKDVMENIITIIIVLFLPTKSPPAYLQVVAVSRRKINEDPRHYHVQPVPSQKPLLHYRWSYRLMSLNYKFCWPMLLKQLDPPLSLKNWEYDIYSSRGYRNPRKRTDSCKYCCRYFSICCTCRSFNDLDKLSITPLQFPLTSRTVWLFFLWFHN